MTTDEEAGSGVENAIFERFIYKMQSSYQDRLGTNIGKALKNRPMRFLADEGKSPIPYEIAEEDSFWTKSRQKKKDLAEREAEKSGQVRQVGFFSSFKFCRRDENRKPFANTGSGQIRSNGQC